MFYRVLLLSLLSLVSKLSFILMIKGLDRIMIDKKLKWDEHSCYIAKKKIHYANYSLGKAAKTLGRDSKKLLHSGLIHSHLVYGSPIWGHAKQCHLDRLLKKQKKAIQKINNLKYRDGTNDFFFPNSIF